MAKITLGQPPKSFERTVKFLQIDGQPGEIGVKFMYRDRKQFGEFVDNLHAQARADGAAAMDEIQKLVAKKKPIPELTQVEVLAREDKANVRFIMGCVEGWNLDVPFDEAAVTQLSIEVPAAVLAMMTTYRDAIIEGRQSN
jgi:hypothetical protein